MRLTRILSLLAMMGIAFALNPSTRAAPTVESPRPTFTGSVVAPRTTTIGPGGVAGGTRVGGILDAAIADVTGDGVDDLISTGRAGDSVAGTPAIFVFPGRGDGTYDAPTVTTCSASGASRIRAADLDGDGLVDVVMGGPGTPATFSVLRGHGNGSFTEVSTFQVETPTLKAGAGIVIARLDGDDLPDLALVAVGGQVGYFRNRGRGQFEGPVYLPAGVLARDIAASDLDTDGWMDLVVVDGNTSTLNLLPGHGDGTFDTLAPLAVTPVADRVLAVDLVGNAFPDLITSGTGASVMRGTGGFAYVNVLAGLAGGFGYPAVLDINADGNVDIALGLPGSVLLGNGTGGFAAAPAGFLSADIGSSGYPTAPPSDLDGDGLVDLLTLTGGGAIAADWALTPLLSRGRSIQNPRVASLAPLLPGSGAPAGVVAADVDGDGADDLVTCFTSTFDGVSYVMISYGGTPGPSNPMLVPISAVGALGVNPSALAAADFDRDGADDIVVVGNLPGTLPIQVTVLFGNAGRPPVRMTQMPSNLASPAGLAGLTAVSVGDFDGDSIPDFAAFEPGGLTGTVLTPAQVGFWRSDGLGGFGFAGSVSAARLNSGSVPVADLNGDGVSDIVLRIAPTTLSILPGTGTMLPGAAIPVAVPSGSGVGAEDLDGDGRADLVALATATGGFDLVTLRSLGAFRFASPATSPTATPDVGGNPLGSPMAFADWNGDGLLDIATDGAPGADLGVFVQQSDGSFTHLSLATLADGFGIATGDLDGDGRPDLANVGVIAGSPVFHEWWRNTTAAAPEIRDVDREKARRGEIVRIDCRLRNVRAGFHADLGADVTAFRYEHRSDDRWRIHVYVAPDATPGDRDLVLVHPDGDEGVTGRDGTRSEAEGVALRILDEIVRPTLTRLKYPDHDRGYVPAGSAEFKLKLRGEGFGPGGIVSFDGRPIVTKSPTDKGTRVSAYVPAERVAAPGVYEVVYDNRVGPATNALLLTVLGPTIDEGSAYWRDDGTLRVEVRGFNMRRTGFTATVRRLDSGAVVPQVKVKRSSKKKVKITLAPATTLPAGSSLEVVVSYRGALGNMIASEPFRLSSP